MSADLLLINSNRVKPAVAPLAIEYLAEAATDSGLEVSFLDLCFALDAHATLAEELLKASPRVIGITFRNTDDCYMATQHSFVPELADVVRTIRENSEAKIVIGGAGFSAAPEGVLQRTGGDFGVVGDGERPLVALVAAVRDGEGWDAIPGLMWREVGELRTNAPRWEGFGQAGLRRITVDNKRYFREGGQGGLETKRGCNQQCVYCADPLSKGAHLRLRPPAAVADEMENLVAQGVDVLHLCDSEFNVPKSHAEEVCGELMHRGLGERVRWYAYLSPAPFDAGLARLMRRAGCVGINFGTDSGDARVLASLGRRHSPNDIREAVLACKDVGIAVMLDLLLGVPGETLESVTNTLMLMKELDPSCVGVAIGVRVYPGTPLARALMSGGSPAPGLVCREEPAGDLCLPTFYLEPRIADDIVAHTKRIVAGDERFFVGGPDDTQVDYNYDDNRELVDAIAGGARGAYWDILRRGPD